MEKVLRSMKTSLRGSKAAWKYFLRPISISNHLLFLFLSQGSQIFGKHKINVKINTSTSNQYLVPSPWGYAEGRSASRSCSSWPRSRGRGWSSCPQRGWTGRPLPSSGSGSGSLAPGWSSFVIFEILFPPAQEIQKVNCAIVQASKDHFLSLIMMRYAWGHVYNFEKVTSPAQRRRAQSHQRRWQIAEQGRDPLWNLHRAEPSITNTKIQWWTPSITQSLQVHTNTKMEQE